MSGPQILQTIYNYGDVDFNRINSIFHNISNSLTTYMRQNGNTNHSVPAMGEVHHYATCLEVQWGWIAFLAAVVGGSIVFLVSLIVTTRVSRAQVWKNSALPMIFHGPFVGDHHGQLALNNGNRPEDGPTTVRDMNDRAETLIVGFDSYEDKLRLSEIQVKSNGSSEKVVRPTRFASLH